MLATHSSVRPIVSEVWLSAKPSSYPCFVFPLNSCKACGIRSITASSDSTAPAGFPGRFRMTACPRTPHTARLKAANFVFFAPSERIRSATPSTSRSQTSRVASGVTSRAAMPVPPVVTTKRACTLRRIRASRIADSSSGTTSRAATRKPFFSRAAATAGPPRSSRSPRADESLMVITAAVSSGVEEDIFFFGLLSAVAIGFIEQSQPLHQQSLGIELGAGFSRLAFKVELEVAARPMQDFEDGLVTLQAAVHGMHDLPFAEVHIAFFVIPGQRQKTAFAAHFERLHQVNHIHLGEAAAQHAVGRRRLGHLFEGDLVDYALDAASGLSQEERLLDKIVNRILRREPLGDIGLGGQNDGGEVGGGLATAELFDQLPAVHSWHAVVGYEQVGRVIDRLQQCIRSVGGGGDLPERG